MAIIVFTQPLYYKQYMAQGQSLNGLQLVWIQFSF